MKSDASANYRSLKSRQEQVEQTWNAKNQGSLFVRFFKKKKKKDCIVFKTE